MFTHTDSSRFNILTSIINIIKVGCLPLLLIIGGFYRSVYLEVIHIDAESVETQGDRSIYNGFQTGLSTTGVPAVTQ
ncbi:hypothetical protein IX307_002921 [Bacteroides pyogenes]|nr:hypothetical protein [Bacteroides pyogenes]MBR8788562.1 hypothetical protein [Bacteroides pyogenes]MBR8794041.1 hypothetical protein [Bacteroides pyogenes]